MHFNNLFRVFTIRIKSIFKNIIINNIKLSIIYINLIIKKFIKINL